MPSSVVRFLNQVAAQPDHPAITNGDVTVTYGQLGDRVRRLAARLGECGPQPRVAIALGTGEQAYASVLATLMAGGYYAPIGEPATPAERNAILREFAPDVVLTGPGLRKELEQSHGSLRFLDPAEATGQPLAGPLAPHRLAFVLFSMPNGKASGIMIPGEALDNYVGFILRETGITPEDRWSQFSDIASELSIFDIFGGLCGGATLFPLPNHVHGQPVPAIKELGLTVWNASSRDIDRMLESGQLTKENMSSLRLMTVCDKTVRPEQLGAIFAAQPKITLLRIYGPIEATASCTLLRLYGDNYTIACQTSVALGDPIDNMQLHLVGGDTSEEGEIAITGPQLADGYWNDPETTQQSFRPLGDGGPLAFFTKEWAERSGGRLYIRSSRDGASVREPAQPAGST